MYRHFLIISLKNATGSKLSKFDGSFYRNVGFFPLPFLCKNSTKLLKVCRKSKKKLSNVYKIIESSIDT